MIDKSLGLAINSTDEDYIMQQIRTNNLADSTVTIHLIGTRSAESLGKEEQKFIKGELRASLYNGIGNTRNGILGVVLPAMESSIYKGLVTCGGGCGANINWINLNDTTTIAEFHRNYYIPNGRCHHNEEDRFCVLVKWSDFKLDPEKYIELAFSKRAQAIAQKVTVRC